jgi:hypothetical protein
MDADLGQGCRFRRTRGVVRRGIVDERLWGGSVAIQDPIE